MTDDQLQLLAVFEKKVRDLITLCDKHEERISELTQLLALKEQELQQAKETIGELNTKCDNMLTARVVSVNESEMKSAKKRLSNLVREVDRCIALLNE